MLKNSGQKAYTVLTYLQAEFQTTGDLTISVLLIIFLIQLRRPLWEKGLILILMLMGLLVSAVSIRKAVITQRNEDASQNPADLIIAYFTYTAVEIFTGNIAACLFRLKSSVHRPVVLHI